MQGEVGKFWSQHELKYMIVSFTLENFVSFGENSLFSINCQKHELPEPIFRRIIQVPESMSAFFPSNSICN